MPDAAKGGGRRRIVVAEIAGAHGVAGLVRVIPYTERPGTLNSLPGLRIGEAGSVCRIRLIKRLARGWTARIDGIETPEAAAALAGKTLTAARESLGETQAPDSYFLADLIDAVARDAGGARLGIVRGVVDFGAGPLLELTLETPVKDFGKALLLPFDRRYVPQVDVAAAQVTVDLARWLAAQR